MIYDRLLILVWAAIAAFFSASWLGETTILSKTFNLTEVTYAADIVFMSASVLFSVIFWYAIPRPLSPMVRVMATLPPLFLLVFYFL